MRDCKEILTALKRANEGREEAALAEMITGLRDMAAKVRAIRESRRGGNPGAMTLDGLYRSLSQDILDELRHSLEESVMMAAMAMDRDGELLTREDLLTLAGQPDGGIGHKSGEARTDLPA